MTRTQSGGTAVVPRMPDGFRIEPAGPCHAAAIPEIERAAATLFSAADVPGELLDEVHSEAEIRGAIADQRVWVALAGSGEPVGFALVGVLGAHAHLEEIDVLPGYGGRGLGAALLAPVHEWARLRGFRAVTLTTFRHLRWNAPFYEQHGYRILTSDELTAELRAQLASEAAGGLDPTNRVAMLKLL
jgi:GNAT superfamily N-acetyltransferase